MDWSRENVTTIGLLSIVQQTVPLPKVETLISPKSSEFLGPNRCMF